VVLSTGVIIGLHFTINNSKRQSVPPYTLMPRDEEDVKNNPPQGEGRDDSSSGEDDAAGQKSDESKKDNESEEQGKGEDSASEKEEEKKEEAKQDEEEEKKSKEKKEEAEQDEEEEKKPKEKGDHSRKKTDPGDFEHGLCGCFSNINICTPQLILVLERGLSTQDLWCQVSCRASALVSSTAKTLKSGPLKTRTLYLESCLFEWLSFSPWPNDRRAIIGWLAVATAVDVWRMVALVVFPL